jgi:hypothetical protein
MHLPNSTVKKFCPEEDGWYATVPTSRLRGTTMPPVPRRLAPVTAQLLHEAFPSLDPEATCRKYAAYHF